MRALAQPKTNPVKPTVASGLAALAKTHREVCRYYASGNGSYGSASGVNCKFCGGAR